MTSPKPRAFPPELEDLRANGHQQRALFEDFEFLLAVGVVPRQAAARVGLELRVLAKRYERAGRPWPLIST